MKRQFFLICTVFVFYTLVAMENGDLFNVNSLSLLPLDVIDSVASTCGLVDFYNLQMVNKDFNERYFCSFNLLNPENCTKVERLKLLVYFSHRYDPQNALLNKFARFFDYGKIINQDGSAGHEYQEIFKHFDIHQESDLIHSIALKLKNIKGYKKTRTAYAWMKNLTISLRSFLLTKLYLLDTRQLVSTWMLRTFVDCGDILKVEDLLNDYCKKSVDFDGLLQLVIDSDVIFNKIAMVQLIILHKAQFIDFDRISEEQNSHSTALSKAVIKKNLDIVKLLLKLGYNPNVFDYITNASKRHSLLLIAFSQGQFAIFKLLLDYGAKDLQIEYKGQVRMFSERIGDAHKKEYADYLKKTLFKRKVVSLIKTMFCIACVMVIFAGLLQPLISA